MLEIDPSVEQVKDLTYKIQELADDIVRGSSDVRISIDRLVAASERAYAPSMGDARVAYPPIDAARDAIEYSVRYLEDVKRVLQIASREIAP